MDPRIVLATSSTVASLGLVISLGLQRIGLDDFGEVPRQMHAYLIAVGILGYACMMVVTICISTRRVDLTDTDVMRVLACTLLYYGLQFGFLPLVRARQRVAMRVLLTVAVLPVATIAGIAVRTRVAWFAALAIAAAAHVLVNDAILYGYLF